MRRRTITCLEAIDESLRAGLDEDAAVQAIAAGIASGQLRPVGCAPHEHRLHHCDVCHRHWLTIDEELCRPCRRRELRAVIGQTILLAWTIAFTTGALWWACR